MEKLCGTCKHYETKNEDYQPPATWGFCKRIGNIDQYDVMEHEPFDDFFDRIVYTISRERSDLVCKRDFGCVLWEQKND
jgi:hypothetical protein